MNNEDNQNNGFGYQDNGGNNSEKPPVPPMPPAPPSPDPYQYYANQHGAYIAPPDDNWAVPSLVIGVLSLVCCGVLGPIGLFMSITSRRRIKESNGYLGGEGQALAGLVCSAISTAMFVFTILFYVVAFLFLGGTTFFLSTI